ncbi:MAG: hypothetical protein ACK5DD_14975 [Cyclobacteriaceae bacterium]|jgi:hypothetical protein
MELRDLIVTPIVIFLVLAGAYMVRPRMTDDVTRRYFFPALLVKIFGALALGFIYQYYYSGGDTYNFHTHGSRHIWEAFWDSPGKGLKLIFSPRGDQTGVFDYASKIIFYNDPSSYFVIRVAAFFDLFTFSAYSATAVLFATLGFIGGWMLFVTFYSKYPEAHWGLALACLFVPSVFFWGSGILKDTLVLAALGAGTYFTDRLFIAKHFTLSGLFQLMICLYVVFQIKVFVLQAFIPAALVWIFASRLKSIPSVVVRGLVVPFVAAIMVGSAWLAVRQIGLKDKRYAIENIAMTARITAYDIRFWTGKEAGSGYILGELDGSFESMLRLAPAAVNVTLFRPYLWEVRNPLMLLSALESLCFLVLTLFIVLSFLRGPTWKVFDNNSLFTLVFSLSFAFAVGVSTFNFGTLSRYKITLMPFYALALVLVYHQLNKARKLPELESTE